MRFAANNQNFDLILGKKWTSEHRAKIDCYHNTVDFTHRKHSYHIKAVSSEKPDEISLNAITSVSEKQYPLYAVVLKPTDEHQSKMPDDLRKLLDEYQDVFPDKLPKGLPPPRKTHYDIKLVPGAKP